MKSRLEILARIGAIALSAGCGGDSRDGYVNIDQTNPPSLDQKPIQPEPGSDGAAEEATDSKSIDWQTVSTAKQSDAAGANPGDSQDAVNAESGTADPLPASKPAINSVEQPAALNGVTTSNTETVDSDSPLNATTSHFVSPQTGLTGPADNPLIENTAISDARSVELLIPEKTFRNERGSNAVRLSYDDLDLLKILNMEPVPPDAARYFPEWLKALNGKSIRIRGFMYPTFEATGLTAFTLARDNGICCFVRQPKIYDVIGVKLADGVTSDYIENRSFDVEGILRIEPQADEKDLYHLYRIDDARVLH